MVSKWQAGENRTSSVWRYELPQWLLRHWETHSRQYFQFVPKEAVDFVLEINKDISSTSTKYFVMSGKWAVAGITERPFDSRLDIFVLFASGV